MTFKGPIFWAIFGDITHTGLYPAILGYFWGYPAILRYFLIVPIPLCVGQGLIQVVPGQLCDKPNLVRPCGICYVTILLTMAVLMR